MIIPRKLTLHNVCQHKLKSMDYHLGITGITGRNGAGKSNLCGAGQYFAITGKTYDRSKSEMLHWDASRGHTEFEFKLGDEDLSLTRSINSGTVKLVSDSGKIDLSGAEANLFMADALGAPPEVILNTCWVLQGDLGRILKMTDMERVKFFQSLAGVQQADRIRKTILTSVNRIPTYEDNKEEMDRVSADIPIKKEAVGNLDVRSASLTKLLGGYEDAYREQLAILGLKPAEDMEQEIQLAKDLLKSEQEGLLTYESDNTELLEGHADPPDALNGEEYGAVVALQRIPTLVANKEAAQSIVDAYDPDLIPGKDENYEELREIQKNLAKVLEEAKLYINDECPTCKRKYEYSEEAAVSCGKRQERLEIDKCTCQELHDEALAAESHTLILNKAADDLQTQLDIAGTYVLVELQKKEGDRKAWETSTEERKAAVQRLETKKEHVRNCENKIVALEAIPTASVSDREAAQKVVDLFELKKSNLDEVNQDLATQRVLLECAEKDLIRLNAAQEKGARADAAREILGVVRDAFHTNKSPRLVMQKMLIGLNARVMRYLGQFEVEFAAYINDKFQIICRFPGGKEIPARLLSGGQQVALAVALRFSLSDLLTGNLPLIVMDEPTAFLDEANVTRLAHVLDKVRDLTKRGLYVQVMTHEPGIMTSFTRTNEV